jgi:hypothetical protein
MFRGISKAIIEDIFGIATLWRLVINKTAITRTSISPVCQRHKVMINFGSIIVYLLLILAEYAQRKINQLPSESVSRLL